MTMKVSLTKSKKYGSFMPTKMFDLGDTILVRIEGYNGYNGNNVVVKVFDENEKTVYVKEHCIPKDLTIYGKAKTYNDYTYSISRPEKAGSYSVFLYVDNQKVGSCEFVIKSLPDESISEKQ
jgi:hypothetical protein